jgi:pyridoxamine 5'-phosphate oxidase
MKDQRSNRRDYRAPALRRRDLADDPLSQFERWFGDALAAEIPDATAMALATVDSNSAPAVRIVLLKHYDQAGFCWYTDYRSAKGRDLAGNPRAACLFHWRELHRQVRISGLVSRLDDRTATEYFDSRPTESRLSAAASEQSAPIADRATLEARLAALREQFPDGQVPKPESWGGYRLAPDCYEFWQGREGRLHDRFRYTACDSEWQRERLQP